MITIDIPEVSAKKSAEDELVSYILDQLKESNCARFEYYHGGCAQGSWGGDNHVASVEIIREVLREFRRKGYVVNDRYGSGNVSTVRIFK